MRKAYIGNYSMYPVEKSKFYKLGMKNEEGEIIVYNA